MGRTGGDIREHGPDRYILRLRIHGNGDIANEALLLFVGTAGGVVLNLYIPGSGDSQHTTEGTRKCSSAWLSRMAPEP